jgi:hypothetical protein
MLSMQGGRESNILNYLLAASEHKVVICRGNHIIWMVVGVVGHDLMIKRDSSISESWPSDNNK